jgi:hypothetical protein
MRFAACLRNPTMLSALKSIAITSMEMPLNVVVTLPLVLKNEMTKKAETIIIGTVTVPANVVASAILRLTMPR